jgi:hypothetical protein
LVDDLYEALAISRDAHEAEALKDSMTGRLTCEALAQTYLTN